MAKKKKILIAVTVMIELIRELPYLYKKAGFEVVVIAVPHWSLTDSSFIDRYIVGSSDPSASLKSVVDMIEEEFFDEVLLATDDLLWKLLDSSLEMAIKMKLSPIKNRAHLNLLGGKIEVSTYCEKAQIPVPPFGIVRTLEEAKELAPSLGWPVMVKESRSYGGGSVWKCDSEGDLGCIPFGQIPLLMEKFIGGKILCIEPLYIHGELVAYNHSLILTSKEGPFTPSIERICGPGGEEVEPLLQQLGKDLQIHSFLNITMMEDQKTGKRWIVEIDFRPTQWIRLGELVGINWARAIKNQDLGHMERPKWEKKIRLFPGFLRSAIAKRNWSLVLSWCIDIRGIYKTMPLYDLRVMKAGVRHFLRKCIALFRR